MKSFRVQLLIAALVVICGISLMGLIYIVFGKPDVVINPGVVVSSPSPVSAPVMQMRSSRNFTSRSIAHPHATTVHTVSTPTATPAITMQTIGNVYESRKAQVHIVGGGAEYRTEPINYSSQQRGVQQTAVMPMTTFVALASVRQVAAPAAAEAPAMAQLASGPRHAPGPPTNTDLQELDQLVEHSMPVGGMSLLAVFALIYILRINKRKKAWQTNER